MHQTVTLFGMAFRTGPAAQALALAETAPPLAPRLIVTINIDHAVNLAENPDFRAAYASACVRTLDGAPLVWLARLRGARSVHRVTGHDLLEALITQGPQHAPRIFALAASADVAAAITHRLHASGWPPDSVQTDIPPYGFESDTAYSAQLATRIRQHATTCLLMGVGAPKSEIWVTRMGAALGSPITLCVGDALTVAAGMGARAPAVLQAAGLEWAWRFAAAPSRLFRRYFIRSLRFPLLALRNPNLSRP
jgi:N-acetylglucosaminyldiphosphoundecaprenol N-acetyl-beta-D-mannosaminyltransferase